MSLLRLDAAISTLRAPPTSTEAVLEKILLLSLLMQRHKLEGFFLTCLQENAGRRQVTSQPGSTSIHQPPV